MNIPFAEKRRKLQNYADACASVIAAKGKVTDARIRLAQLRNEIEEVEDEHRRMLASQDSAERELIRVGMMNTNRELTDAGTVQAGPAVCVEAVR